MREIVFNLVFGGLFCSIMALSYYHRKAAARQGGPPGSPGLTRLPELPPEDFRADPLPVRAFEMVVIANKVNGNVVIQRSSATGLYSRLVIYEPKRGEPKSKSLSPMAGEIHEVVEATVREAKDLGEKIYGKRKKGSSEQIQPVKAAVKTAADKGGRAHNSSPSGQVKSEPKKAKGEKPPLESIEGRVISMQFEDYPDLFKGDGSTFSSFTVTLDTDDGHQFMYGKHLHQKVEEFDVKPGDVVRIAHKTSRSIGSGRTKKFFEVTRLNEKETEYGKC